MNRKIDLKNKRRENMIAFILLPLLAGYEFFGGLLSSALDYFNRSLLPAAPESTSLQEPYNPPFAGGQCAGDVYQVVVDVRNVLNQLIPDRGRSDVLGPISSIAVVNGVAVVTGANGTLTLQSGVVSIENIRVNNLSNPSRNCGNLPNPNVGTPTGGNGLADDTSPPDLEENTEPVYEGSPLVAIPSFASILAAALAAAKAAATALEAIAAIADAIAAIGKLLDRLKEFLDGEEKPKNRSVFRYDFGSIERDGFLRLYPFVNLAEFKAEMLDLQFLSIPTYYGRYFGSKSPNFYRFKELGYIAFVSPTFGVLSQFPLEFGRVSIPIPENSIGFFFHLGLEGGIIANVSAFYSTPPIRE